MMISSSATSSDAAAQAAWPQCLGAYIDVNLTLEPKTQQGVLAGRTAAIKDLFDVEGQRTGFGHPLWLSTHAPAAATAPAVLRLLRAGALVRGRTHLDELAYSLNGENAHYGTPNNPAAPGRIPGGSSSGSAVAAAAGHVDIGLGSDTGGSVRVPASYCGVFGIRPTHGRVPLEGVRPLAPSFDTVGWFTRSLHLLTQVASVMLDPWPPAGGASPEQQQQQQQQQQVQHGGDSEPSVRWLWPVDLWALADPATSHALRAAFQLVQPPGSHQGQVGEAGGAAPGTLFGRPTLALELARAVEAEARQAGLGDLLVWLDTFRVCQAGEIWQEHGAWVTEHRPVFGPGIKERLEMASHIMPEELAAACLKRQAISSALLRVLGSDGVLVMPTAPGPAPLRNTPAKVLNSWRRRLLSMTSVASLAGLPQVTLPLASVEGGLPVGLSLVGPQGSDERLLAAARAFVRAA